jgi:tripartite-type tricarboxylate transporter receptor subunit TctC
MWNTIAGMVLILLSFGHTATILAAAEFPTKPIEIVCPFTPGSSMDLLSRLIADMGPRYVGQPMVVTNKPGAGGSIGAADVIKSRPDGYKLFMISTGYMANALKTQKVPFEKDDLIPLANFMEYKQGLAVRGDASWRSLNDLLDYARKNPGELKWAHSGRGIPLHISGLLIFRKAEVKAIEVPYHGSPEILSALLGGHIDAASIVYGTVKDHVLAGKVRYLTFYADHRYPDQPGVPSVVELGFPDAAKLVSYVGLYAHKNTPETIKNFLIAAFKRIYDDPKCKKGIEQVGEEPRFGGPEFVKESIRKAEEVGDPILKELGLYVGK